MAATDGQIQQLQQQRAALSAALVDLDFRCKSASQQQEALRGELELTSAAKYGLLLATSRQQRLAKRCAQ